MTTVSSPSAPPIHVRVITPTHDPRYLPELLDSLLAQTYPRWSWVVAPHGPSMPSQGWGEGELAKVAHRSVVAPYRGKPGNVGAAKLHAFTAGRAHVGDTTRTVLLELDHDDLLAPTALERVARAFDDPEVGFAYSDCADWSPTGAPVTYHAHDADKLWGEDGWRFGDVPIADVPRQAHPSCGNRSALRHPKSFEPSAQTCSLVFWAPNHLRAWRASVYDAVMGHDPSLPVCDDHDLLIRTYLATKMVRIPEVLYFYRVDGANTWAPRAGEIRQLSYALRDQWLHELVARETILRRLPAFDLGGVLNTPGAPWWSVDVPGSGASHEVDLAGPWPWPDNSVGAFRAFDLLEHLPDKLHAMREIHRCLAPGGWLLSATPKGGSDAMHSDPTHVSHWVERSFRYHTEEELNRYLPRASQHVRFMPARLVTTTGDMPYVVADLVALKDELDPWESGLPGRRGFPRAASRPA